MAKPTASKVEIQAAYEEFEAGLKEIRKDLRALVERTIKDIDTKQTAKILKRITEL